MAIQRQSFPPGTSELYTVGGGATLVQWQPQFFQFQNQPHQQPQVHVADKTSYETSFGFDLGSLLKKQSVEIDQYTRCQSEKLRVVLREQRKRELTELISKTDDRTRFLLRQKDEEIARAITRTSNLESLVLKLQNEAQTRKQIATQNELHVANLRNSIQMLQQASSLHDGVDVVVDDSASCCDESCGDRDENEMIFCRMCHTRERNVVLLPCRHLCCCPVCVNMIDSCPVCQTEKKASFEALFH